MAEKRILYFIPEVDISSDGVYQSQVMGQAAYLSQRGYKCLAVGFVNGDGNIAEFKQYVNRRYGVDVAISSRNISGIPFNPRNLARKKKVIAIMELKRWAQQCWRKNKSVPVHLAIPGKLCLF